MWHTVYTKRMVFDVTLLIDIFRAVFVDLWWFWLLVILLYVAACIWMAYIQQYYKKITNPWMMMEIKFPREITRSPRSMEQVFATVHAIRNSAADVEEKWWDGEVPLWFSFEAVSFGGEIHFYLFIPTIRRNHFEAVLYANYPDIEITHVADDYIHRMPKTAEEIYASGYRMFGNELILGKTVTKRPEVYPIRTYVDFEAPAEEKEVDPMASLLETLSRIKPQEHLWFQLLVRPKVDDEITDFHKAGQEEMNEIKERARFVRDPAGSIVLDPTGYPLLAFPSPAETEAMKAIERKVSKPAFDAVLRYIYFSPQNIFSSGFGRRSILSAMNQYASESANKFKHNVYAWTLAKLWYKPYIFPMHRAVGRRERLWEKYQTRDMYPDTITEAILTMKLFNWGFKPWSFHNLVLNTEELATIFHPPTILVLTGPLIKRVEARKVGPPAGLPIYGEEDEELPGWKEVE